MAHLSSPPLSLACPSKAEMLFLVLVLNALLPTYGKILHHSTNINNINPKTKFLPDDSLPQRSLPLQPKQMRKIAFEDDDGHKVNFFNFVPYTWILYNEKEL